MGSDCWREIDIKEWSNECQSQHLDRMIRMLVARSGGSMRKLCVSKLQNDMIFSFIAEQPCGFHIHLTPCSLCFASADALQTLRLQRSKLSNSVVEQISARFSNITFLDLSYSGKIASPALKAIVTNCIAQVLCQNMHPIITDSVYMNDEAHAIATTMPRLKHLEIAYNSIETRVTLEILESCPELEFLDLRGCHVELDSKFFKEKFPKMKVLGPDEDLIYDENLECYLKESDTYNEWTDRDPFEYSSLIKVLVE
ncbi:hypothetical protein ACLB2K_053547 [Fragaria x ananassa]